MKQGNSASAKTLTKILLNKVIGFNMKKSLTPILFWALIIVFAFIAGQFFIPQISILLQGSELFLIPFIIFSLLGFALIFFTLKEKKTGLLKKFLLLTGISAASFFINVFLHNAFYALAIVSGDITTLRYLMEIFHASFFLIAIFGCPAGFLVGSIGSIVLFVKKSGND